jgi:alanine dehydrogenase
VKGIDLIGTKIASGYYQNQDLGLPPGVAIIILMDLKTSLPKAIMDGTFITSYRTGAAGAVAAEVLARPDSTKIGVIGAGTQARMQILALQEMFNLSEIRVWDKYENRAKDYVTEMSDRLDIEISRESDPEGVVRGADILVTVTPSREAIVKAEWIEDGMHINAIGADGPGKQELDPNILQKADRVVVDSLAQCVKFGELQHAIGQGLMTEKDVHAEIGQILLNHASGRKDPGEVTVFDATGIAAQDIFAAAKVLERAIDRNIGSSVNLLNL